MMFVVRHLMMPSGFVLTHRSFDQPSAWAAAVASR